MTLFYPQNVIISIWPKGLSVFITENKDIIKLLKKKLSANAKTILDLDEN